MSARIFCAATPTSGVRHRMMMLSWIKHFADSRGYDVVMLWGVTGGVSFCRFEELFSPIPGVTVRNVLPQVLEEIVRDSRRKRYVRVGRESFRVFHPGTIPEGELFSFDLHCAGELSHRVGGRSPSIPVKPSPPIRSAADSFATKHRISDRLGIRVRVEEHANRDRKPHRITKELDDVIKSIARVPWYTRAFLATDSEYVQQMLASHFCDTVYLKKNFDLRDKTGRYVNRQDKHAMFTFLMEVDCLCRCDKIINIGRFLNDQTVAKKMISEPYREAALMHLRRV